MKSKIVKVLIAVIAMVGLVGPMGAPAFADGEETGSKSGSTSSCTDICNCPGASVAAQQAAGCPNAGPVTDIKDATINILNVIIGLLSVVAVIVIVIGGTQYMISNGDPGKTKKAKDTILYAVIGLIICGLAAVIVNFVVVRLIKGEDPAPAVEETTKTIDKNAAKKKAAEE